MLHLASGLHLEIPGWVYLWFVTHLVLLAVVWKVWRYASTLSSAAPEERSNRPLHRIGLAVRQVFGQRRRLDDRVLGGAIVVVVWAMAAHLLAFGWNVLRGTLIVMMEGILPESLPPYTDQVVALQWVMAGIGGLGLVALLAAGLTRYVFTPIRLRGTYRLSLTPILVAIVFGTSVSAPLLRNSENAVAAIWWLQILAVLAVIAYIAFSRDKYMLFAPVAAFATASGRDKLPPPSRGSLEGPEFTWRELLGGIACSECGRCALACTTSTPRELMTAIRRAVERPGNGHGGDCLPFESLWGCDTCGVCMELCPSFNEHVPLIVQIRRSFVAQGLMPPGVATALEHFRVSGNCFGLPADERAGWVKSLEFELTDARQKTVEYLWIVGDHASYDPVAIEATQAAARVLHRAGVDFGILYESERNSGNDVRRAGAEDVFEVLAAENHRAFHSAHFEKIVTSDPHTYNALKNEYHWDGPRPIVLHLSELLVQLFRRGYPPILRELNRAVVYHDPCYLGRYNAVYDEPRRVLQEIGLDVLELPQSREMAQCCGGGGGRIWMNKPDSAEADPHALAIVRQVAGLRAVKTLAVACPHDLILLRKAVARSGLAGVIEVRDIAELVDEATRPAEPPNLDREGARLVRT